VQKWGQNYQLHAIGTGPYKLQSWSQGHQMVLVANPGSWRGKPKIARLVFDENVSSDLQFLRFQRDQYQLMVGPLPSEIYAKVLASPSLKKLYHMRPQDTIVYLAFNTTRPAFQNVDLREAVNYAIDKQLLIRDVTNGRGSVMTQPLPSDVPGYNKSVQGFPYNPTLAKQLVKASGYKGQQLTFVYPSNTSDRTRTAEIIQSELKAIGLNVYLQGYNELGTYWTLVDTPSANWDICWDDWSMDFPNAVDIFENLMSTEAFNGNNSGNWTDPQFQKLIDAGAALPATQQATITKDYQQAEQIAVQKAAWGYLFVEWKDVLAQSYLTPQFKTTADQFVYLHPVIEPQFNLIGETGGH